MKRKMKDWIINIRKKIAYAFMFIGFVIQPPEDDNEDYIYMDDTVTPPLPTSTPIIADKLTYDIRLHNLDAMFNTRANREHKTKQVYNFLTLAHPVTPQDYLSIWVDIKAGNVEANDIYEGEYLVGLLQYLSTMHRTPQMNLNTKPLPQ